MRREAILNWLCFDFLFGICFLLLSPILLLIIATSMAVGAYHEDTPEMRKQRWVAMRWLSIGAAIWVMVILLYVTRPWR